MITSIVDLKKSQYQTFKKGLIQTNAFRKSLTKNASETSGKFAQNVQRFGWTTDRISS